MARGRSLAGRKEMGHKTKEMGYIFFSFLGEKIVCAKPRVFFSLKGKNG
jgi:hypothetical protein